MKSQKYTIEITNVNGNLEGMLLVNNSKNETVCFSPINILGNIYSSIYNDDIVNSVVNNDQKNMVGNKEQIMKIYNSFETAFNISAPDTDVSGAVQYYRVVSNLLLFFNFRNAVTLPDMYNISEYFCLNFKWKAYVINNINACNGNQWHTDDLTEFDINDYEQVKNKLNSNPHLCVFLCNSKADVVYSILQYLLLSGYYFKPCLHCQKFYASKTLDSGFCSRRSPLKGFENYECEEAVKQIKKHLQARKRAVCSNIIAKDGTTAEKKLGIENIYDELKSQIEEKPNIENLQLFEKVLTNNEMKALFYTRK